MKQGKRKREIISRLELADISGGCKLLLRFQRIQLVGGRKETWSRSRFTKRGRTSRSKAIGLNNERESSLYPN